MEGDRDAMTTLKKLVAHLRGPITFDRVLKVGVFVALVVIAVNTSKLLSGVSKSVAVNSPVAMTYASLAEPTAFSKHKYDIAVISNPPDAEILVDDQMQNESTPATLRIEEGRQIKITVRASSYESYEDSFKVSRSMTVRAILRSEKKK